MMDLAPFSARPAYALPDAWITWAGSVLAGQPSPIPAAPGFAEIEAALSSHGLLPLLYDRLRDDPLWPALPEAMRTSLAAAFRISAARSLLLETELQRIGSVSPGLGLLKGAALGHAVYANPALRPVSDLDLLVGRDRAPEVKAQLLPLGYRGIGLAADPRLGRAAARYRAELPLIAQVPGIGRLLVELHWSIAEIPHYVDLISASALLAGARHPDGTLSAYLVPRPAVLLAYAAGHLALHHSRDLRLIWLVDLDRLVRAGCVDWAGLLALAEGWKLGLALHAGLQVVNRWLGTPLDAAVMAELRRLAQDPVAVRSWGLGDEMPGRAWRRAAVAFSALPPGSALRYAGWLGLRTVLRPLENRMVRRQEHGL